MRLCLALLLLVLSACGHESAAPSPPAADAAGTQRAEGDRVTSKPDRWPFADPPDTAAITTREVLDGAAIALVFRDEEDGSFEFHSERGAPADAREGRVIGLGEALRMEPSLREVADLPPGWRAHRAGPGKPWVRVGPNR